MGLNFTLLFGLLAISNLADAQNSGIKKENSAEKPAVSASTPTVASMKKFAGYFNFFF
ncbi:MAG: hypothetical protein JWQ28_2563, partial [Pedobacter sp.]|nr:hypothetical protein [Pedobacter sp.]